MSDTDKTYTVTDGDTNITIPELDAGDYEINLTFTPDENQNYTTPISKKLDLTIEKRPTYIVLGHRTITTQGTEETYNESEGHERMGVKIYSTDKEGNELPVNGKLWIMINMALIDPEAYGEMDNILIKSIDITDYTDKKTNYWHYFYQDDFDWDAIQTAVNDKLNFPHVYRSYYLSFRFMDNTSNNFMTSTLDGEDIYMIHKTYATVTGVPEMHSALTSKHNTPINRTITITDDLGNGIKGAVVGWKYKKVGLSWDTDGKKWGTNPTLTNEEGKAVFTLPTDSATFPEDEYSIYCLAQSNPFYLNSGIVFYGTLKLTN